MIGIRFSVWFNHFEIKKKRNFHCRICDVLFFIVLVVDPHIWLFSGFIFFFLGGFYWVFISSFNGFPLSVNVVFVFAIFIRFVFVLIGIVFPNYLARPFFFVPLRFLWRLIIVHSFMETISSLAISFSFFVFFFTETQKWPRFSLFFSFYFRKVINFLCWNGWYWLWLGLTGL